MVEHMNNVTDQPEWGPSMDDTTTISKWRGAGFLSEMARKKMNDWVSY